jgi:hypothetical protein
MTCAVPKQTKSDVLYEDDFNNGLLDRWLRPQHTMFCTNAAPNRSRPDGVDNGNCKARVSYVWIVGYDELGRILPDLLVMFAGLPAFLPAALLGRLFNQNMHRLILRLNRGKAASGRTPCRALRRQSHLLTSLAAPSHKCAGSRDPLSSLLLQGQ